MDRSTKVTLEDLRNKKKIKIGFVGENLYRSVWFVCDEIYAQFPHAAAALTVVPPQGVAYPAVLERGENVVVWNITDSDLVQNGEGEIQMSFVNDEVVVKTYIGSIEIHRSLTPSGEAPEGIDDFLTRAGAALTAIPETIDAALEEAKESGEFDGPQGPPGEDGKDGRDGVDGKDGKDGKDGQDGAPGQDGKDGKDGQDGAPGQDGKDGKDGRDGTNGTNGTDGTTFIPSVSSAGVLSWTNDGGKQNPQPVDIAGAVRGSIDETVTGQNPVIVGEANHRYICGEVQTISITPPQTGIIDVVFTSGTTPTILTVPNTVKFPGDFDPSALEASTTYEINIMDGVYGVVQEWT